MEERRPAELLPYTPRMPANTTPAAVESTKPTCFIAMPITTHPLQAEKYSDPDHWKHVMDVLFVPAIEAAGYAPILPIAEGGDIIHARIITHLEKADMVLCDLSALNANVMFEFGVRTALDRPAAVVSEKGGDADLPFDTGPINTHFYASDLKPWDLPGEIKALTSYITSTAEASGGGNRFWHYFGLTLRAEEPVVTESPEEAALDLKLAAIDKRLDTMVDVVTRVLDSNSSGSVREAARTAALKNRLAQTDVTRTSSDLLAVSPKQLLDMDDTSHMGLDFLRLTLENGMTLGFDPEHREDMYLVIRKPVSPDLAARLRSASNHIGGPIYVVREGQELNTRCPLSKV